MEFFIIATAHFLALLSPGPDFFLIMQVSLRLPTRYGIALCAGIAAANGLYLLLAISGLEALRETGWLMSMVRYLGAAYLIFLGMLLLKAPRQRLRQEGRGDILTVPHLGKQWALGFFSAILNPKNGIFYLSLFTVLVSAETEFTRRCLYALWMTTVVFLWDAALVFILGSRRIGDRLNSSIFWLEKVSGLMLTFFGCYLPFY